MLVRSDAQCPTSVRTQRTRCAVKTKFAITRLFPIVSRRDNCIVIGRNIIQTSNLCVGETFKVFLIFLCMRRRLSSLVIQVSLMYLAVKNNRKQLDIYPNFWKILYKWITHINKLCKRAQLKLIVFFSCPSWFSFAFLSLLLCKVIRKIFSHYDYEPAEEESASTSITIIRNVCIIYRRLCN